MGILVWWLLPGAATVLAVTWAAWVRRPPRVRSDAETVAGYAQFRAALGATSGEVAPSTSTSAGNSGTSPTV